ncbi:MAG: hypothetical protein ETSY1_19395 [Candidatus Entotheonella factor]|uniref:Glycosyl transferase family 1 domain-containing protein n=1 Tax=Entotheonella factor TaxID=1429438 RepID=W4LJN8_ENTF1|nr:glycosyltransferase [Candidatus Entotheonella palauensis]ETW98288.1 MAG: hypothetical protein ETSY1_19395 [Candidatus Entotheonella factor]
MRILHVIPAVAARYGGPSQVIFAMCRALMVQGVEPLIVTTDADGPGRLPVELGRPVDYRGVPVLFFPRQYSEALKYSRPLARWLHRYARQFDAAHVAAVFSHASFAAAHACRTHRMPYIVRPLGSLATWSMQQKPWRKRLLWHMAAKRMLHGSAAIHFTSREEQRQAESRFPWHQGVVIPLGLDEGLCSSDLHMARQSFRQRQPALGPHPFVLALARLHPVKQIELLIHAFLDLMTHVDVQTWKLVIAGDGQPDYVQSLRALVRQRGGEASVLFTGWLDGVEKHAVLQEASLLAQPSLHENFGLSIAEAMASATPVLVSPQVNLSEDIQRAQAGWVVPCERQAVRETLHNILRQPDERRARGLAGQDFVRKQYAWSRVAAQLVELYQSICQASPCLKSDSLVAPLV